MKNKRTFLASLALGVFLMALAAPVVAQNGNGQEQGIDKKSIVLK
ncbi:MAG: hypothetical protein WBB27_14510 [Maribacter sp.]